MNGILSYRIEGWLEDEEKWYTQELGNASLDNIMESWRSWTYHRPNPHTHIHYRLILQVTQDIILTDTEW